MTTDELAAIIAAATERAGWHVEHGRRPIAERGDGQASTIVVSKEKHMWTDEIGSVLQAEDGDFIANAPRTIIALVERIRELEAQRDAWKERFSDSDILPLKTLSECTGVSVYALRAACYRGAIQYWKINNNQHYASTIAEVRRYKRQYSPDQP